MNAVASSPPISPYHSSIDTHTHGCKFVTVLAHCTRNGRCARWRLHRILTLFRERDRERERERADTSSITFSSGGYTVMSDESIFGAPPGEGGGGLKAPGRRGVLPWSGWKGTRRRGVGGFTRRRTCVLDDVSLFGDGDHYSIRFHFSFEEKRLNDMRPLREMVQFFFS